MKAAPAENWLQAHRKNKVWNKQCRGKRVKGLPMTKAEQSAAILEWVKSNPVRIVTKEDVRKKTMV